MNDEFYVGYLPKMPAGVARRIRSAIAICLLVAVACAIIFAQVQRTFVPSTFEYGQQLTFEGTVQATPYPTLLVPRPGTTDDAVARSSRFTLVGTGKHGADRDIGSFDGKVVRLKGQLIYRNGETLIEVMSGTVSATEGPSLREEPAQDLGPVTLKGEIVDSKCYFGVMNPGSGKVHRDCAVRCLSGGIPPSFVTSDYNGVQATFLLLGRDRQKLPKEAFLSLAGRPVVVRGLASRTGDTLYLATGPNTISPAP